MAVVQISRIQQRRGLEADLPNLASAELGWSVDTRKLYIGNGTIEEGAPSLGRTEILTQYSILDFESSYTANITALQSNVTFLQSNVNSLNFIVRTANVVPLASGAVSAVAASFTTNNGVISYSLDQGSSIRTGTIVYSKDGSTVTFTDDYSETATTDIVFTMNASVSTANLVYSSTNLANLRYRLSTI